MELKKVVINGVSYLGTLEELKEKKEMVLKDAMPLTGDVTRTVIAKYFQRKNIGDLTPISFGGRGVAYSIAGLSAEEQMYVDMAESVMKMAKSRAIQSVENGLFETFLGK